MRWRFGRAIALQSGISPVPDAYDLARKFIQSSTKAQRGCMTFRGGHVIAMHDLPALATLPPADRERVLRQLHAVPARALSEGWQRWELEDILSAHSRKLGVSLTPAQKRAIISRV
jgi:hypothetical protein